MSCCETECKKYVPLVKQNVMILEVSILGGKNRSEKKEEVVEREKEE